MQYIKALVLVLFFFLAMVFLCQNQVALSREVALQLNLLLLPSTETVKLPFYFVVIAAFLLGAVFCFLLLMWDRVSMSARAVRAGWRVRTMQNEQLQMVAQIRQMASAAMEDRPALLEKYREGYESRKKSWEEERKKAEQKKKEEERKKAEQERKEKEKDSVAAALRDARRKASSRVESGDRGTAVEQALAQARKNAGGDGGGDALQAARAGHGDGGGGGGEGDGPGGGGLNEVYLGQIMLAVRPNWSFASASRANFACIVHVSVDMNGEVQDAQVTQGSGNAQFDASAVNAVIRTGKAGLFPKPPSPEYCEVDLVFRMDELSRR